MTTPQNQTCDASPESSSFDEGQSVDPVTEAIASGGSVSIDNAKAVLQAVAADQVITPEEMNTSLKPALAETPKEASEASRAVVEHFASAQSQTSDEVRQGLAEYLNTRGYDAPLQRPANDAAAVKLLALMLNSNVTETDAFYASLLAGMPEHKVIVAVLDDGFDLCHPALDGKLWTNPDETLNGIDDDHDGQVDDLHGADFVSNDGNPNGSGSGGHATHVGGIITAETNVIELMALRVFEPMDGQNVAEAIDYAAANGARVVNMSFKVDNAATLAPVLAAIQRHPEMLFVKSAGNEGRNLSTYDPASYLSRNELPNLMVISAATEQGKPASYSNVGAPWSTHAMQGSMVRSSVPGGGYALMSGTSMSTPKVGGVDAKIWALDPLLTAEQVRGIATDASLPSPDWTGLTAAGGLVDEDQACAVAKVIAQVRTGMNPFQAAELLPLTPAQKERVLFIAAKYLPQMEGVSSPDAVRVQLPQQAAEPHPESVVQEEMKPVDPAMVPFEEEIEAPIDPVS